MAQQLLGALQTVGYLVLAIFLLMLMITIHEFGHYITAKIMHFKIYEFSIGMGKALFQKTKKNGEKFSIRLIPLGGYCSFGEDDVDDTDPNSFNNKAPWKRLIVLFSGAFFNFISAIFFAVILLSLAGYSRAICLTDQVVDQEEKITLGQYLDAPDNITGEVHFADAKYIESINGVKINILGTNAPATTLENTVLGDKVTLGVVLKDNKRAQIVIDGINKDQLKELCREDYIGIPANDPTYHKFGGALLKAVPFSFEISGLVLKVLWQMVTGKLGMKAIGGTVATVSVMGSAIGEAVSYGAVSFFIQICFLITLISINLAVFNWLPIPSLDGARMVFVLIEWIRKKPINRELEAKIHAIGIICLLAFVVFADLFWIFNNISFQLLL